MVAEECSPSLAVAVRGRARLAHILLDGAFGDVDAELEQLAADAFCAPKAILSGHAADQSNCVATDSWLSALWFRLRTPEQPEPLLVPTDEGCGLDDQERVAPLRNDAGQQRQQSAGRGAGGAA